MIRPAPFPDAKSEAEAIEKWANEQRMIEQQYVTRHCARGKSGRVIIGTRVRYSSMHNNKPMQIALLITDALRYAAILRSRITTY